jgi:hypothetical protein
MVVLLPSSLYWQMWAHPFGAFLLAVEIEKVVTSDKPAL